jgi:hypothetical protein
MEEERKSPDHINSEDIKKMSREELEFILYVMLETQGLKSYFSWENGLVHRLGVIKYEDVDNPSVPVVRTEGIINFQRCLFDSFESAPLYGTFRQCRFRSYRGFAPHERGGFSKYSENILPMVLWDSEGVEDYGYTWNTSRILLPSTGLEWRGVDLHPGLNDNRVLRNLHISFGDMMLVSPKVLRSCERIWLEILLETEIDLFGELYDEVIEEHRQRILESLDTSESDILLRIRSSRMLL